MMVAILCLWALSATSEAVTEAEPGLIGSVRSRRRRRRRS
jgi:hypothetical protein